MRLMLHGWTSEAVKNRGYRSGPLSNWEGTVYQFLNIMGHAYQGKGLVVPEVPTRELR